MSSTKVIFISGGSRGLGAALVEDMFDHGWSIATFSRSRSDLIDSMEKRDPEHARFLWEALDSADHEKIKEFVLSVARRFGRIDALVNNAAVLSQSLLALESAENIHRMISVNLESTIMLTRACSRVMLNQNAGAIVNVSSLNAVAGHSGVAVYSATKAALDGLTRSLARELGPRGIRINSIAPGYFESDMSSVLGEKDRERIVRRTPLARLGTTKDIVAAIRFLISEDSAFITGQTLVVDGGITC